MQTIQMKHRQTVLYCSLVLFSLLIVGGLFSPYKAFASNYYTVTYNANGGVGSPISQTEANGVTLAPNTFTRPGYVFVGWNTIASGVGGTMEEPGREVYPDLDINGTPLADNITLYAIWEIPNYEFDTSTGTIIRYTGPDGAVKIPSAIVGVTVRHLGTNGEIAVFGHRSKITSIVIPNSVTSIEPFAFASCTGLTSVSIPSSVTSIGEFAFLDCTSLVSVTIPGSVHTISDGMFMRCTGLRSVTISSGVKTICTGAFQSCTSLTSLTIPASVTTMEVGTINFCSHLTTITYLGGKQLTNDAFPGVHLLKVVYYHAPVRSTNAYLAWRRASTGSWNHGFSKTRTSYQLTISNHRSSAKVRVARSSSTAKVYWRNRGGHWHFGTYNTVRVYKGHSKYMYFKVVSQSGHSKTYTVKVYRKAPVRSTNAYLCWRRASTGSWNHKFSKTRTSYQLTISRHRSSAKVRVARSSSTAKVYWRNRGGHYHFGNYNTVKVSRGHSKYMYFKVVSQSGHSKTYLVKVYRKH